MWITATRTIYSKEERYFVKMKMDVEMNNARQVKLVVGAELRRIAFTGRTYAEFMNEIRQVRKFFQFQLTMFSRY